MIVWEPKLLFLAWVATPLVSVWCILILFCQVLTVVAEAFKAMVAARIGRQPHEIMLKRQGERPFKDHLTLDDYGVSNGVQLDLELDTGD
jgi:hypothetical protein